MAFTLLLLIAPTLLLPGTQADLGDAVWRSARQKNLTEPIPEMASAGPMVLRLEKLKARPVEGVVAEGNFYVGTISVGQPVQEFQVIFDTGAGYTVLPHRACGDLACLEHTRYSQWKSRTSRDIDANRSAVDFGENATRELIQLTFSQSDLGQGDAQSIMVEDQVCLGAASNIQACARVAMLAAVRLDETPFRAMPYDGVVGLGLESLSSPVSNFFGRLIQGSKKMLPQFGLALWSTGGEIHFGAHDRARLASPLQWFPVDHPENGYWQVSIQAVRIGNRTVDDCREDCHALVDSGASRLGAQPSRVGNLRAALGAAQMRDGKCQGPDLEFDLGGMSLLMPAEDYTSPDCMPQVGSLDLEEPVFLGVYVLGEALLRRYYAAFDWEAKKMGFARSAGRHIRVGYGSQKAQHAETVIV